MIPTFITELLIKRSIAPEQQEYFLHPDFNRDIPDGSLMKGMSEAVERIKIAIAENQTIGVFGDYDADGVPATAVMVRGFRRLNVEVISLIPTRSDGYGLNSGAVQTIISKGITLLITVDNGTVSKAEIRDLKQAGIDTIVCDHHEPQEGHMADKAVAILNPKQSGCPYPFKELCGCGLAWKLLWQLFLSLGEKPEVLKWDLDLVALSTIADMVPLVGENRVLAVYGLQVFRKSRNLGLKALVAKADLDLSKIGSGTIGFQIAPRINAPSRMHSEIEGNDNVSLALLTTEDELQANRLSDYLQQQNGLRQTLLTDHLVEAKIVAEALTENVCLVLYKPEWSAGVIGLVAGRMLELYQRPVIVLALEGAQIKGSVRSVEGVNAVELLASAEEFLEKYGGHAKAAGLTLKEGGDPLHFSAQLQLWLQNRGHTLELLRKACLKPAELALTLDQIDINAAQSIKSLEPFGIGFPTPLFTTTCYLKNIRTVGSSGQHLSCQLEQNGIIKKAIAFQMGELPVSENQEYRVYYTISLDEWNGKPQISCQIQRLEVQEK